MAVSSVSSTELGYVKNVTSAIQTQLNSKVPATRKVAGKALSADVSLAASDVGAVPTSRKVNNHALTEDVTVTKSDVGLSKVANHTTEMSLSGTTLTISCTA